MKYYLGYENDRNARGHKLYEKLLKIAFGAENEVISGHHFMLAPDGDINKGVNEIPSADTILFDHDIMSKVFGDKAVHIMSKLAMRPVEARDEFLKVLLDVLPDPVQPPSPIPESDIAVAGDYPEAGGY